MSRPEKGLQKRVNLMQQKTNSDLSRHYLPRQLRHLILQEYLSGVKTAHQLSEEHGIPMSTIHKMGQRWKAKNSCSFVSTPNPYPIMSRVTSEEASELLSENKALRRRLEEALLRLEGYTIQIPVACIFTDQMTVIVTIQYSATEQATGTLLVFLILKFRQQSLVSTIFCLKTFNRLQHESVYYFFVIIPIKALIFQQNIQLFVIENKCLIELSP